MARCCDYHAGKLRTAVSFERETSTSDGAGGRYNEWSELASAPTRAFVRPISGSERWRSERVEGVDTIRIVTRYSAAVQFADRVTVNGRIYDIERIDNVEFADKWLEITATGGTAVSTTPVDQGALRTIVALTAAYVTAAQDTVLRVARVLQPQTAAYVTAAQDIVWRIGLGLSATTATYTTAAQAAVLRTARLLVPQTAAYVTAAQVAALAIGRRLVPQTATYETDAQTAQVLRGLKISAQTVAYITDGKLVDLTYSGGAANFTLSPITGAYVTDAQTAALLVQRVLIAQQATYDTTGVDATFNKGRLIAPDQATYITDAVNAGLRFDRLLSAQVAAYVTAGQDASVHLGRLLGATASTYTTAAQDADLRRGLRLAINAGSYATTGQDVTLTYGGGGDAYTVNSFSPPVVADFAGVLNSGTEYYRVGGSDSTFDDLFTFSRAGNATMTDSDGLVKWAPHNLLYPTDLGDSGWATNGTLVKTTGQTDPDGGTSAVLYSTSGAGDAKVINALDALTDKPTYFTYEVVAKYSGGSGWFFLNASDNSATATAWFDVQNGTTGSTGGTSSDKSSSITSLGGGWYLCSVRWLSDGGTLSDWWIELASSNGASTAGASDAIVFYAPRLYRSDLGGMVNNPDRGDSYIPTTTAAVYQARRNHHRFNGSTYDNKGILLESEARTNAVVESHITTANWAVGGGTAITDNNATWIDGNTSAALITADSTGTDAQFFRKALVGLRSNSSNNVQYIYVRNGTADYVYLSMNRRANSNANEYVTAVFDLTGSNTSASQTSVGSTSGTLGATYQERVSADWWRITLVGYIGRTSSDLECGFAEAATGNSFDTYGGCTHSTGWGSETFYANGAQAEGTTSTPSSYIPTSGATVTRAAETLTIAAANSSYSATGNSVHIRGEVSYADTSQAEAHTLYYWDKAVGNEYARITLDTTGGYQGRFVAVQFDGAALDNIGEGVPGTLTPGLNKAFNVAARHMPDEINLAINGTALTANTTVPSMPELDDAIHIGLNVDSGASGLATYDLFRVWAADIGDTGIESATS